MSGLKNKIFALAFAILATHQVLRFIFSLTNHGEDHHADVQERRVEPGIYQSKFSLTQFSGLTNQEEQLQRRTHLYSSCASTHVPKTLQDMSKKQKEMLLKHIIVSDKYQFLYCYIPKVACSNWKRVVMLLHGLTDSARANAAKEHPHGLKYLSEYSEREIQHKLKHYYKFTFVRNPLERILSAYRNKFGEIEDVMRTYGVKIIKKYRNTTEGEVYEGKIPGDDVTFEEFIRFLVDSGPAETMNEHWAPMVELCQPCAVNLVAYGNGNALTSCLMSVTCWLYGFRAHACGDFHPRYDFVGSYDSMYEDSEDILKHISAPGDVHLPARQAFYSPMTSATAAYFYSLVKREFLGPFLKKYSKDFTLFSYPFPEFLHPST